MFYFDKTCLAASLYVDIGEMMVTIIIYVETLSQTVALTLLFSRGKKLIN